MRLTTFTDYCLRALIFAVLKGDELTTIDEIAEHHRINRNHLVKVVFRLGQLGYLQTLRGKGGAGGILCRARSVHHRRPRKAERQSGAAVGGARGVVPN